MKKNMVLVMVGIAVVLVAGLVMADDALTGIYRAPYVSITKSTGLSIGQTNVTATAEEINRVVHGCTTTASTLNSAAATVTTSASALISGNLALARATNALAAAWAGSGSIVITNSGPSITNIITFNANGTISVTH